MSTATHLPDASNDRLVRSTFQLLISNGTGVVLGVGFWSVAARIYPTRMVGLGTQEVQAMVLISAFALLNLGTVFPRFLFAAGSRAGLVLRSGYAASTSIALLGSIVFVLFFPHPYIEPGLLPSLIFVGSVLLWVVFTIEDAALVGLRSTFWVPVENTSFSVAKIALLPLFAIFGAYRVGVYSSWVLPLIGCTAAINYYLWRRVLPAHISHSSGAGVLPHRRVIKNVVLGEYLGGLSFMAMASVPVLMVGAILGVKEAAYLQIPWLAGTSFDALLFSFATSLIVEASARPSVAAASVRRSVRLALTILGPSVVVLIVGAPLFLRILEPPAYAANGTRVLQLIGLALPFMAINVLYVTYARLARRVRRVFMVQVGIGATVLALCFALIHGTHDITGVGLAYFGGQFLMAMILLPSVIRQYRHPEMAPDYAAGAALVARSSGAPATGAVPAPAPATGTDAPTTFVVAANGSTPSEHGSGDDMTALGTPSGEGGALGVDELRDGREPHDEQEMKDVHKVLEVREVPKVWRRRPNGNGSSVAPDDVTHPTVADDDH